MKRSRPTIAMLLAAALTFTTVCPALAAEGGVEAGNAQTAPAATEELLTDEMEMTEDPAYGAGMDAVPDQDDASEADNVESGYTEEAPAAEEAVEEADPAGVQETEAPAAEEAVEEVDPAGVQETEEVPVQDSEEGLMEESEENLLQDSEEDFPQDLEEVSGEDLDNTEASTDDESASEEVIEENLDSQNEFNTITDSETVVEETLEQNEKKEAELAEDVIDSGICGDDVIWTLSEDTIDNDSRDYILVISGYGEMYDIEGAELTMPHSPWRDYVHEIRTIIIEDGVTSIGDGAFKYCSFSNITIPNSISRIGEYAFSNCDFMENIEIPYGITKIESHVFFESNCYSLESITIPDGVISIGDYAFFGCESLQNITIPDSVTNIEECAFFGCESLQNITIPNGVTNIGNSVFCDCGSLQTITIPDSITNIEEYAFCGCTSLQTITIPDGVTNIGSCAFRLCSSLQNITIPNGVTNIGEGVFSDCDSLQTITIPDSITNIEEYAFYGCDRLQTITIPDSVTTIGESAFYGCESLQSITIPRSVTSIKQEAFYNCSSFKSIFYAGTKAEWDAIDGSDFYLDIDNLVLHTSDGDFGFIRAEKITLNKTSATLVKGASLQLKATVTPANASDAKVTWKTNNSKVLTVSGTGKVTAVAAGTATITAVTGDGTIKAICTIKVVNPYTIKFNKNAAKATLSTTSKKVNPGSAIGALPTPKYSGYYFQGWYTAKTGGTKVSTSTKPSKSMTLYAHWVKRVSINKATVKVASCVYNGKAQSPAVTVTLGKTTLKKDTDFTVAYSGSRTNANGKAYVTITGKNRYSGNVKKQFTVKPRSITSGGVSLKLKETSFNYDGKAKRPGCAAAFLSRALEIGKDFKISYSFNIKVGTAQVIVTGIGNFSGSKKLTFKIVAKKTATLTLDPGSNGYFSSGGKKTVKITSNEKIGTIPTPIAKRGYKFIGWYEKNNGGLIVSNKTRFPYSEIKNCTAVAKYEKIVYKVTFNAYAKDKSSFPYTLPSPITFTVDTASKVVLPKLDMVGCTFHGWQNVVKSSDGKTITKDVTSLAGLTANVNLYANYNINQYIIVFQGSDDGTVQNEDLICYGTEPSFKLPKAKFVAPERKTFDKWKCVETGAFYENEAVASRLTTENGKIYHFEAVWKVCTWITRMEEFRNDSRWQNGDDWNYYKKPIVSNNATSAIGCAAFVNDFVAYVYGRRNTKADPVTRIDTTYNEGKEPKDLSLNNVRVGDVVAFGGTVSEPKHFFAVLEINEENGLMYTMEGNYGDNGGSGGKIRAGYGYQIVDGELRQINENSVVKLQFTWTKHFDSYKEE